MADSPPSVGHTISHYRVLEQIGAGGMGIVYRARDERLERDVALKILPPRALADEEARKRFRKEALALSKLSHSNIAHVYDFDSQGGTDFLVMEYVYGTSLSDKISRGQLKEEEVLALGEQIAKALEDAHEHGIVHRDLKPGNIMVTGKGEVKLLDFGLAKLLATPTMEATESLADATPAGTLQYMSPESVRGEPPDFRSDIYSAGVTLYEMGTGHRPFDAKVAAAVIDNILHRAAPAPQLLNPSLSPRLQDIILKCLEKEPGNRYQSARELGIDLRRLQNPTATAASLPAPGAPRRLRVAVTACVAAGAVLGLLFALNTGGWRDRLLGRAGPGRVESVAVLPLDNLSHDPEQDYFADGMTEELIADLGNISALRVISRTSVMHYKGTQKTVPDIARELNVDAVVEGSVLRSGDRVRITAQLIQARADKHLWAQSYERDLRDVLGLQSEVARAIADQVRAIVTSPEQARLATGRAVNPEAYDLYLKGRFFWNQRTEPALRQAAGYFEQALQKDGNYALAYAGLADCYNLTGSRKARPAAEKALALDDSLAEAHTSLAYAKQNFDWDFAGAEREFKPNYVTAHQWYAALLSDMARPQEAIAEAQRALELDPLSIPVNTAVGVVYELARRYDDAERQVKRALELNPNFTSAHGWLAAIYFHKRMYPEFLKETQVTADLSGNQADQKIASAMTRAYTRGGYKAMVATQAEMEATSLHDYSESRLTSITSASPYNIAVAYAELGDRDQAFKWLERCFHECTFDLVALKADPDLDDLRSDPRFQDLLRRVGLPQ
jgi:eukaryotic-like serine/threonine-protein kinase